MKNGNFNHAFRMCSSLVTLQRGSLDFLKRWAFSYYYTFYYCNNLKHLPDDLSAHLSNATLYQMTFASCPKLASLSVNLWNVSKFSSPFNGVTALREVFLYNLPNNDERIEAFINVLPDRTNWTGEETPTLIIRKNIPEARDTLTEEQIAALEARGWILGTESSEQ